MHPKPFLKWAGGKKQLLPALITHLPEDLKTGKERYTYIEPFVGGGAMLFHLLPKFPNITRAVINDINPKLISVYKMIRDNPLQLIECLENIDADFTALKDQEDKKGYYLKARQQFNIGEMGECEESALLIFLNRTCFNGLYRVNSKGCFNVPFGKYANPKICNRELIMADSQLLQKVEINCGDFALMTQASNNHAFVYLDPPYCPVTATSSFTRYSAEGFDDQEQIRLKKFVDLLTTIGCKVLLSNSDVTNPNPANLSLETLYSSYHILRVLASRAINSKGHSRGKITELLIKNYP